ncbi:MAG: DUF4382 domain-containing protein [Chromatiales bacterium]|jgi:hypothetical protein
MIMQSIQTRVAGVTFASITALLLAGCGGGGDSSSSDGSLSLRVTDAPVDDLCAVWVTFSEVHLVPGDDGGLIKFDESNTDSLPASIELTTLVGGKSVALLNGKPLPAGDYNQIRLVIDDSSDTYVIEKDGNGGCEELQTPLFCPSCTQSGLKLNLDGFSLAADELIDFTIDFDLNKSIILPPGRGYLLKPTHTVIETAIASTQFTGIVTDSQSDPGSPVDPTLCEVYVYQGDVVPDDNCSDETDTSACDGIGAQSYRSATLEGTESPYSYLTGYMNVGTYTVTLACGDDDPEVDDNLTFLGTTVIDAATGENVVDFTITD